MTNSRTANKVRQGQKFRTICSLNLEQGGLVPGYVPRTLGTLARLPLKVHERRGNLRRIRTRPGGNVAWPLGAHDKDRVS